MNVIHLGLDDTKTYLYLIVIQREKYSILIIVILAHTYLGVPDCKINSIVSSINSTLSKSMKSLSQKLLKR